MRRGGQQTLHTQPRLLHPLSYFILPLFYRGRLPESQFINADKKRDTAAPLAAWPRTSLLLWPTVDCSRRLAGRQGGRQSQKSCFTSHPTIQFCTWYKGRFAYFLDLEQRRGEIGGAKSIITNDSGEGRGEFISAGGVVGRSKATESLSAVPLFAIAEPDLNISPPTATH